MKLITDNTLSEQNPTIPVRWCVDRDELVFLKNANAENVHILLAVRYIGGREDRQFIPLNQAMTYVSFRWPGEHTLHAKLFWCETDKVKLMKSHFLERSSKKGYENNIFKQFDDGPKYLNSLDNWTGDVPVSDTPQTEMKISVPKEYFAKEPPEWLKSWTNLWFDYPPVDQCAFRRRLILALTIQPPVYAVWLVLRTILFTFWVVCLAIFGMRRIKYSVIIHPFTTEFTDIHRNLGKSWFTAGSKGEDKEYRVWFHPLMLLFYYAIITLLIRHFGWIRAILTNRIVQIVAAIIVLIVLTIVFYGRTVRWLGERKRAVRREKYRREDEEERARRAWLSKPDVQEQLRRERERKLNESFSLIGCATAPATASLSTLPPANRTFYLRYMDLKMRLCKPFAG